MASEAYLELLRDPRWQRKRLEILQRDGWTCLSCWDGDRTLHVHHKRYKSGFKPWEYEGEDLETLCEPCHAAETERKKRFEAAIGQLGAAKNIVLGFAEAAVAVMGTGPEKVKIPSEPYALGVAAFASVMAIAKTDKHTNVIASVCASADAGGWVDVFGLGDALAPGREASPALKVDSTENANGA